MVGFMEKTMDSYILHITDHAYERGKQRLGLNKKSLKRISEKALDEGAKLNDMKGSLYKYLSEKLKYEHYENTFFRVYGETIFVYSAASDIYFGDVHPVLVTVMYVPKEIRKQAYSAYIKARAA